MTLETGTGDQTDLHGEWEPDKLPITQELIDELKSQTSTQSMRDALQEGFDKLQAESKPKGLKKLAQDIKNRFLGK